MTDSLLDKLRNIVGPSHLLSSAQVSERATHFWDSTPLTALALVRPANTQETSAVLKVCHDANQSVVTHGGVTGLVEGDRSTGRDVILSLERQQAIESTDPIGKTIIVQAGAILQNVQQQAAQVGLQLGLDLGARGSCTIGGNVSTNAGGLSVLRYGMMREQVLGLEAVLADGTIISSMNRMMKNNAGYDLKQLFVGSEGTLGIVTRVVLRLRAETPEVSTALLAFECFDDVLNTLSHLDSTLNGTLDAFEVIWQPFFKLNTDARRDDTVSAPLSDNHPIYAIVETRSTNADNDALQQALEICLQKNQLSDAVIAQSGKEAANIWRIREHIEIALEHDPAFVYDISLPIADMAVYVHQLEINVQQVWPGAKLYVYGHLADGNLHVIIAPPPPTDTQTNQSRDELVTKWHEHSNQLVYKPLEALGGSISAEHGIGYTKKSYLPLSRTEQEITLMRLLKTTLDPKGILNPGKVIDV